MEGKEVVMQIIFLPRWLMIVSFFVVWPVLQVGFSKLANKIPDSRFDENSWFFRPHKWERGGKIYAKTAKVRLWKRMLPDGAAVFGEGFKKKRLERLDEDYLRSFVKETCRAEWAHWMQITPFWIFGLWAPFYVIWIMLGYALILNLPCIIAQRYNRPRLAALLNQLSPRNK